MAEYIDREALIDCLRKERSEIEIREDDDKAFNLGVHQGYVFAIHDAKSIPAADVRPVVLCRDCMMRQYCKVAQYLGADGFCSIGEKKRCKLYNDCEYREIWKCCCDDCQFMEES